MVPIDELEPVDRHSRVRKQLLTALPVALVLGLVAFAALKPAPRAADDELPEFSLPLLEGGGSISNDDLRGAPLVINFWASWCGPCREETPLLERTYQKFRDEGVRFLGVNVMDDPAAAKDFLEEFPVSYPIVRDADRVLATPLDVGVGLPQTFFVNEEGGLVGSSLPAGERDDGDSGGLEIRTGRGAVLGAISKEELESKIE
ncbi:MAG: TlpA family protein disulfide reductase, partial [Actinomycetota bacterium]